MEKKKTIAMRYTPVIGLEVHVELKTRSKMFCACSADYFGREPNTHTCPVCLGLPGALPVPNKKAIDWCILIGLALNCDISLFSKFDRKNYFYPDLSKGYQISQYDEPFCENGHVKISNGKRINIRRVHMEEDTGKLIHEAVDDQKVSLIDFNRSGVPLVEIVTEPDFESAEEVIEYLKTVQQIVRYLEVSNADMEKGNMRLEPNISLRKIKNSDLPKYKVEVKNINSFKFVEKTINFEIERQKKIFEGGKTPVQETRGWGEAKGETISQRSKEEAHDYRYFPEPDIPPIHWTESQVSHLKSQMIELPQTKFDRLRRVYGLSDYDAEILTKEKKTAIYFEEAVRLAKAIPAKTIANWIINKRIDIQNESVGRLIKQISMSHSSSIDESKLQSAIKDVIKDNEKAVNDYKNGKTSVIMFLIGNVMRKLKTKINPSIMKIALEKALRNSNG